MNFTFLDLKNVSNEFILKVAGNKIRLAARLGVPLAENWITDENGKVIEEELENVPNKFYMAPMGGTRENSSHKGNNFSEFIRCFHQFVSPIFPMIFFSV